MSIMVSAHNPMTGPRHLGHHVSTMRDWPALQEKHECFLVVDDMIANLMSPLARSEILDRSIYTAREFLACGIDESKVHLVFTSMLPEIAELTLVLSRYVDISYCQRLYDHSYLGMLAPHHRAQLGLAVHPTLAELIHPQLALPALTMGLGADLFQGGEEISGYVYIMQAIGARIHAEHGTGPKAPEWLKGGTTFLPGLDGHHMATENAVYVSEDYDVLRKAADTVPGHVLCAWAEAIGRPNLTFRSEEGTEEERGAILEAIEEECRCYRDCSLDAKHVVARAAVGSGRAKFLLRKTIADLKKTLVIPDLVD